jgi:hypothetical protein
VSAESTPDFAQELCDRILDFQAGDDGVQTWLDSTLAANAGTGAEWYILCLAQSGECYDFSAYEAALLKYLSQNSVPSATTRQKYALCLSAIGSTNAYIAKTAEQETGSLGVMSYVYGLHLLRAGYTGKLTANETTENILALQKQDGGWAISGSTSDADVTAMALQALAPDYGQRADVTAAVDRALSLLSTKQQASGGFVSYGVENPESASQVIIALCALGIDPLTDTRFIKNGNTAFDAIASFSLGNGSYCHQAGGAYSEAATAQVLCAATAYLRYAKGLSPLYSLDGARPDEVQTETLENESNTMPSPGQSDADSSKKFSYKPFACIAVVVLGGIACLVLFLLKKRHYKNFVAVGVAVAVLLCAVLLIDLKAPEDYYHGQIESKQNPIGTVTLTVRCDNVPGLDQIDYLPNDGIILAASSYEIEEGETVYEILIQAARANKLHVDVTGSGEGAYVRGISYLYEQQHGDLSGWTYTVNGASPSVGCGAYILSDGDEIIFEYSLTLKPN